MQPLQEGIEVRPLTAASEAAVLRLNNAHAVETSLLDEHRLRRMLGQAFLAAIIGEADAFLIAFDQDCDYDGTNFAWFRARYPRFAYIDRVVTAPAARGRGYAKALYGAVFERAVTAGHVTVACEVNLVPPNPISDAFHAALGFVEVGRGSHAPGRTVRYLMRPLP